MPAVHALLAVASLFAAMGGTIAAERVLDRVAVIPEPETVQDAGVVEAAPDAEADRR